MSDKNIIDEIMANIDEEEDGGRYELTAKGVLLKCLVETLEMPFDDILEISDYAVGEMYEYACSFAKMGGAPGISFEYSKNGQFVAISDLSETGEVM